jgi:hypothetical protein
VIKVMIKQLFLLPFLLFAGATLASASYVDDIGYTQLASELGSSTPNGTGVTVSQIEAPTPNYRPDPSGAYSGVTFTYPFPTSNTGVSGHATTVADNFYGDSSMANGVTSVASYEANNWIGSWLNYGTPSAPGTSLGKVQNFSWIGSIGTSLADTFTLARMDYAINRDGIIAVTALNNGTGSVPNLMAAGYNSIAVGLSNGNHSYGTTSTGLASLYGNSRSKPDIVAPAGATSYATPIVSSAAALLVQVANGLGDSDGSRPEIVKSILMAGATKSQFSDWGNTSTAPLDDKYGSGQLNIRNSYNIMHAGQANASSSTTLASTAWDWGTVGQSNSNLYFFDLSSTSSLSAVLTWNIQVTPNGSWSSVGLGLGDLYLRLYHASAFSLGSLVSQSITDTDNVQLIWANTLTAGRYAIQVANVGTGSVNYGLSWLAVPEPSLFWPLIAAIGLFFLMDRLFKTIRRSRY